jgi:hypothetical protein
VVCHIVLAHREPALVERMCARLTVDGSTVLLHVDARRPLGRFEAIPRRVAGVTLLEPRVAVRWAQFSLVEAALHGLRWVLGHTDATHAVLLSGQDYPIKPDAARRAHFAEHEGRSFVQWSAGDPEPVDRSGNRRWYWDGDDYRLAHRHYWMGRWPLHLPNRLVPWVPRMRPPAGLQPLQGSQWWALSREATRWCLETVERRPDVLSYFRRVFVPDESFVPMLLLSSPLRASVVNDDLHFIDWDGWHPRTLTTEDLPALRRSPKLFARKFSSQVDAAILDSLDEQEGDAPAPDPGVASGPTEGHWPRARS